jgi:hypothetical protein
MTENKMVQPGVGGQQEEKKDPTINRKGCGRKKSLETCIEDKRCQKRKIKI